MAVFVFLTKEKGVFDHLFFFFFLVQRGVNFSSNKKVTALVGRWASVGYVITTSLGLAVSDYSSYFICTVRFVLYTSMFPTKCLQREHIHYPVTHHTIISGIACAHKFKNMLSIRKFPKILSDFKPLHPYFLPVKVDHVHGGIAQRQPS